MNVSTEAELPQPAGSKVPPAFVALVAPDSGMERQARVGKVRQAFLVAWVFAILAGAAAATRVDARTSTIARLEQSKQIETMSDRQIDDEVTGDEKKFIVLTVAKKALAPPLDLLLFGFAIVTLGWFLKGRIRTSAVFPVSAAVLLPGAIANLLDAVTIFNRHQISPQQASLVPRTLADVFAAVGHPLMGAAAKLGAALDFYSLWAAVLMAFGIVACTTVPTRRALIGTLVAWACVRLLLTVASGGGHP